MNDSIALDTTPFYLWDTTARQTSDDDYLATAMLDSVFATQESDTVAVRPSMFESHSLAVAHSSLQPRTPDVAPPWTFAVLTILTALLCLYFRLRKIRVSELMTSIVDSRAMDRMLRNNNMTHLFQLVPMGLLMLAEAALVVHSMALDGIGAYLLLTVALAAAYLLRNGLMRLLGVVFDDASAVETYITSNYLYHLVLASLLVPLLFLYFYLPHGRDAMQVIVGIVVGLEFVVRLFRGLKLFLTQSSGSQFYLFYYLCIVELAPILILTKYFIV